MSDDVVIVSAARTPVGSFNGAFATTPAHDLGAIAIKAALERAGIEPGRVSEVIMGQILTAAQGQNPARQASIAAGIPVESPAWGVNQLCGSGLRTVALGYQALLNGDSEIVVAGGQESMSMAPHAQYLRGGVKMGAFEIRRHHDQGRPVGCLQRLSHGQHRRERRPAVPDHPRAAGRVRGRTRRTRPRPRRRPAGSRTRSSRSPSSPARATSSSADDEYPRHGATLDAMAKLKPAFEKDGTVTAGSASGINDGAAAVVLMTAKQAAKEGKKVSGRIVSWGQAGVDPKIMGTGPIPASRAALKKAGWSIGDLDLIEANEAFAAQACAVNKDLGWDTAKVNVNGGAIAIGHPVGASGARVLVTLLHEMQKRDAKKGLATLCIGGGMGIAMCIARD